MHPVPRKGLARQRFRLRDLILMVWESQIFSAAMQIKALAQVLHRHNGAFNVPARTARADRTLPEGLAFLRGLPQGEVARIVLLILIHVHAGSNFDSAKIFFGKFAVLREFGDAEIIRAVLSPVCDAFLLQRGNKLRHLLYVFRSEEHTSELQSHSFISYAVFC